MKGDKLKRELGHNLQKSRTLIDLFRCHGQRLTLIDFTNKQTNKAKKTRHQITFHEPDITERNVLKSF